MSTSRKSSGSSNNSGARASRPSGDAAKKWVAEETRAEAKELFAQHNRETSGLDVLSRCKKLNELLSSDVLSGKGDAKAQLKEILGILHAGPKRPAFLDKPPVTAIAGKRSTPSNGAPEGPLTPAPMSTAAGDYDGANSAAEGSRVFPLSATSTLQRPSEEVEDIITLLNGASPRYSAPIISTHRLTRSASGSGEQTREEEAEQRREADGEAKAAEAARFGRAKEAAEQQCRAVEAAERERKAKEAAEAAERERRAKEAAEAAERERRAKEAAEAAEQERRAKEAAEAAERERRAKEAAEAAERERRAKEAAEAAEQKRRAKEAAEAAERERKAKEAAEAAERERAAAVEALRLQRVQCGAALCIQSHWRGHCGRRQAAQRRLELAEQHAAASILQAAWRARQVVLEHRKRLVAAGTLQCAVRAWRARRHLHQLRVEAFTRRHAARIILRAFIACRARGYTLGPLRLPPGARPIGALGVDGAALLSKRLRLRSAMDTRLAPECVSISGGGSEDDSARQHRTVVTHMERVRQVSANERNRRCDVSERAIMVASEHRDTAEALAIARQGFGTSTSTSTPRAPSPSTAWPPPQDGSGIQPDGRRSSSSRPGSEAGGPLLVGSFSADVGVFIPGLRPPTGLKRTQGSIGA
ncbi:hypothetical protein PLESTM_000368800 [Pleodorina starrii]|nr:hypothetical protein PLESTM_000368800 [Pleodorina starrii]